MGLGPGRWTGPLEQSASWTPGCEIVWGRRGSCSSWVPGRKLRSKLSSQNGDTRTILMRRDFQVSKQNEGTGTYVWEVEFREQSQRSRCRQKQSHCADSTFSYLEEAVGAWLWVIGRRCLISAFIILTGKSLVTGLSSSNFAWFVKSSPNIMYSLDNKLSALVNIPFLSQIFLVPLKCQTLCQWKEPALKGSVI